MIITVGWSDTLSFSDFIVSTRIKASLTFTLKDRLSITDRFSVRSQDVYLTESMFLHDSYDHDRLFTLSDAFDFLNFSDAYTFFHVTGSNVDTIEFTDTYIVGGSYVRQLEETLEFTEDWSVTKGDFTPTIPVNNPPTDPDSNVPNTASPGSAISPVRIAQSFTLGTVLLPAPEWGDVDRWQEKKLMRAARGEFHVKGFRQTFWSQTRQFTYTFKYLTDEQIAKVKTFIAAHIGLPFNIVDHHERTWNVILLNPDSAFSNEQPTGYSVSWTFQWIDS